MNDALQRKSSGGVEFSDQEIERYSRQLILRNWGLETQARLKHATVIVSSSFPAACYYLAAAGVGNVCVLPTNLDEVAGKEGEGLNAMLTQLQTLNSDITCQQVTLETLASQQLPANGLIAFADELESITSGCLNLPLSLIAIHRHGTPWKVELRRDNLCTKMVELPEENLCHLPLLAGSLAANVFISSLTSL